MKVVLIVSGIASAIAVVILVVQFARLAAGAV